jgi:hypothetical protein
LAWKQLPEQSGGIIGWVQVNSDGAQGESRFTNAATL